MTFAGQIATYRERGFSREQAEVITMMHAAAGVLFRDFPDSFLLFGGAALLLFYQGVRHSADLDLLQRRGDRPTSEAVQSSIVNGLASAADALNLGPLQVDVSKDDTEMEVLVKSRNGSVLFKVDINRFGSVLESEVEEYSVSIDEATDAQVKAASRDFILLQKAECFLLRRIVKVRDAFDIHQLRDGGATLSGTLKSQLADTLMAYEIEATDIAKRIAQIDEKHCVAELRSLLPSTVFNSLAQERFKPLRDTLLDLYEEWL